MKTATLSKLFIITALTGVLFSCNKSNSTGSSTATTDANLQTESDDQTRVSTESDAAFDDVNTAMVTETSVTGAALVPAIRNGIQTLGGPGNNDTVTTTICDAVVTVDTVDNPRTITITYNGTNCALDRTRKGSVVISIAQGVVWSHAGAVVTVNFDSLAITRLSDNTTIVLNGTHTYTNVSGGSLLALALNQVNSITHTITSSNMSITFPNGAQRTWNVARQRVFTYSNEVLTISTSGTYTSGSLSGISEWGVDRFGNNFTAQILQPRVLSNACSPEIFELTGGEVALNNTLGTTTITYGLNSTGAATGCPVGSASYYFELVWTSTASGKSYTFIMPY